MENKHNILELADGTKIDTLTGKRIRNELTSFTVPTNSEAQQIVIEARRKLTDLPALPATMTPIAVVIAYSMFGLDNTEIAVATNLTVSQVTNIKMLPEYETMYNNIIEQVMKAESNNVRNMFVKHSKRMADKVMQIAEESESDMVALVAAKDILDRAGHRPADMIIENRNKTENELRIVFVKKDETPTIPMIDITPQKGV